MELFRERLLSCLVERHAISEQLVHRLLAWRHPGFSAHAGEAIPPEDGKGLEDVACYRGRSPLSLKKLVYLDGQRAVLYHSKMNETSEHGDPAWRDRARQRGRGRLVREDEAAGARDPRTRLFAVVFVLGDEALDRRDVEVREGGHP